VHCKSCHAAKLCLHSRAINVFMARVPRIHHSELQIRGNLPKQRVKNSQCMPWLHANHRPIEDRIKKRHESNHALPRNIYCWPLNSVRKILHRIRVRLYIGTQIQSRTKTSAALCPSTFGTRNPWSFATHMNSWLRHHARLPG
jgi:hypothetical protein